MLLVINDRIYGRRLPSLSERKMKDLLEIFKANKVTFRQVMACCQGNVPAAFQQMFSRNLLNILPPL